MHGGGAPRVKAAAERRMRRAKAEYVLAVTVPRVLAAWKAEQERRRRLVARVLGMDEDDPRAGSRFAYGAAVALDRQGWSAEQR